MFAVIGLTKTLEIIVVEIENITLSRKVKSSRTAKLTVERNYCCEMMTIIKIFKMMTKFFKCG